MLTKVNNLMIDGALANILDFGAVGDGITDDTAAFQAIAEAGLSFVCPPQMTFRITERINFENFNNLYINLQGSTIYKDTLGGTAAGAFRFNGGNGLELHSGKIDSSYDGWANGSTGSNANILLGDEGQNTLPMSNIFIHDLEITNGNHANIDVIGQGGTSTTPMISNLTIENIYGSNAAAVIFVYKGLEKFTFRNIKGNLLSTGVVALDTYAATDSTGQISPIRFGTITDVSAETVKGGSGLGIAGRGHTVKGWCYDINVSNYNVRTVGNETGAAGASYGLLIVEDSFGLVGSSNYFPRDIKFQGKMTDVYDDQADAGNTNGWLAYINRGCVNIDVDIEGVNTARGIRVQSDTLRLRAKGSNIAERAEYPVFIDKSPTHPCTDIQVEYFDFRNSARGELPIVIGVDVDDVKIHSGKLDPSYPRNISVNSSATNVVDRSSVFNYPYAATAALGSFTSGEVKSVSVNVPNAEVGDNLTLTRNPATGEENFTMWWTIPAANTVTLYVRNDTGVTQTLGGFGFRGKVYKDWYI